MGLIGYKEIRQYSALAVTESKYESLVPDKFVIAIDSFFTPWIDTMHMAIGDIDPEEAEARIQVEIYHLRENMLKNISTTHKDAQKKVFQTEKERCEKYLEILVRQWQTYDVERGYR